MDEQCKPWQKYLNALAPYIGFIIGFVALWISMTSRLSILETKYETYAANNVAKFQTLEKLATELPRLVLQAEQNRADIRALKEYMERNEKSIQESRYILVRIEAILENNGIKKKGVLRR